MPPPPSWSGRRSRSPPCLDQECQGPQVLFLMTVPSPPRDRKRCRPAALGLVTDRLLLAYRVCKDFLPVSRPGFGFFALADAQRRRFRWPCRWSHITSLMSAVAVVSKQSQEQTASLQTALLLEVYRAGHDTSRTGEPWLKTGEQARSDAPRAVMTRQQNRRVLSRSVRPRLAIASRSR